MQVALTRVLDWRMLTLVGLAALNVVIISVWLPWAIRHGPWDFYVYRIASFRLFDGTMYEAAPGYFYNYSPVFAWLFTPVGALGIWAWRVLQISAVLTLPSWPLRIVVLASYPLWVGVWEGNVIVFVSVLAFWTVQGNRWAALGFMALAVLVPRPLMLPVLGWVLWKQPWSRWPFAGIVVMHGLAVLATGYAVDWAMALITRAGLSVTSQLDFSPSRFLGMWWLAIGIPLAIWLTTKGRLGWASLAISPYVLEPYWLMLLAEPLAWLRRIEWPLAKRDPPSTQIRKSWPAPE